MNTITTSAVKDTLAGRFVRRFGILDNRSGKRPLLPRAIFFCRSKLRSRKAHQMRVIVPDSAVRGPVECTPEPGVYTRDGYMGPLPRVCGAKRGLRSKYGQPTKDKPKSRLGSFWSKLTGGNANA